MRYQVLDNSMPADCFNHKADDSWEQSTFDSFDDALRYARKWLGDDYGGSNDGKNGICLRANVPWDYSGYGDTIEIREVK